MSPRAPSQPTPSSGAAAERLQVIDKVPFLHAATPETRLRLADRSSLRRFARGDFLFHEGEPFDRMFVIVSGTVASQTTSAGGAALNLHIAGPGETPGHLDLLGQEPYSTSARALSPVAALVIGAGDLSAVLARDLQLNRALALELAQVVRSMSRTVVELAFLDLPRRLAGLLVSMSDADGRVGTSLTQSDLASRLAVTRQSVNQALRLLARAGLVTLGPGGGVTAVDLRAMRDYLASSPR